MLWFNTVVPFISQIATLPEVSRHKMSELPSPLKSAAAMRRQAKSVESKTIALVWEQQNDAPNGWFISAAIVLTLFAVGILFLAMYLK